MRRLVCSLLLLLAPGCHFAVRALGVVDEPDLATAGGDLGLPPDLAQAGDLALGQPVDLRGAGMLAGTLVAAPLSDNLTLEGAIDWIVWGSNGTFAVRKSGGSTLIDYTLVGGTVMQGAGYATVFTWSDGTPTVAGSSSSVVYTQGGGNGFQFAANADPAVTSKLRVYVRAYNATCRLVAHLSDGSAADYLGLPVTSSGNTPNDLVYELTYRPASATKLTISWTNVGTGGGNGIAALAAATIQ